MVDGEFLLIFFCSGAFFFVEQLVTTPAAYAQLSANGHILDMHTWNSGKNPIHVIWRHVDGTMFFGKK